MGFDPTRNQQQCPPTQDNPRSTRSPVALMRPNSRSTEIPENCGLRRRSTAKPDRPGGNNVYDVTVLVSDGRGGTDTKAIAVKVTNVNEIPTDLNRWYGGAVCHQPQQGWGMVVNGDLLNYEKVLLSAPASES